MTTRQAAKKQEREGFHLPLEIVEHIADRLPSCAEFAMAMTCKNLCARLRKRKERRGDTYWVTFPADYLGSLTGVSWLHANGCPWTERTFEAIVSLAPIEAIQWARRERCPWDASAYVAAAARGDEDIFAWLEQKQCPKRADRYCGLAAARDAILLASFRGGNTWIMRKMLKGVNLIKAGITQDLCREAAKSGKVSSLRLSQKIMPEVHFESWPVDLSASIAASPDEVIPWVRENIQTLQGSWAIISGAARGGLLDVVLAELERVDNTVEYRQHLGNMAQEKAARGGHFEIVRALYDAGYKTESNEVCRGAAERGLFTELKWALDAGFECGEEVPIDAARAGHLDIVQFLHARGHVLENLFYTIRRGHISIAKWAKEMGLECYTSIPSVFDAMVRYALHSGSVPMLSWVLEQCPGRHSPNLRPEIPAGIGAINLLSWMAMKDIAPLAAWIAAGVGAARENRVESLSWLYQWASARSSESKLLCNNVWREALRGHCYEVIAWAAEKDEVYWWDVHFHFGKIEHSHIRLVIKRALAKNTAGARLVKKAPKRSHNKTFEEEVEGKEGQEEDKQEAEEGEVVFYR